MDNETEINTLELLGVTPRFILQYNAISRSVQSLSATAKKLTAMAMSLLPTDLSNLSVSFTFNDFCKALGVSIGGEQYQSFKKAVDECMECIITIETETDKKGKKEWKKFTWFIEAQYNEKTSKAMMTFSPKLADVLKEMKRVYAKINLQDLGKLQSKYALRYFEMAKSYESLAGKDGNRAGYWYFEREIPELRDILSVPTESYKETRDFRKKVIEEPVKEINNAGIGLEIATEGIKQGRTLKGIRFNCTKTPRKLPAKRRGRPRKTAEPDGQQELPELSPRTTKMRVEKELDHLAELHPDEFSKFYNDELVAQKQQFGQIILKQAAKAAALLKLRAKYGIKK